MSTLVVYSGTADGDLSSNDAEAGDYLGVRAGSYGKLVDTTSLTMTVGQYFPIEYYVYEGFLGFDTSSLPDTDSVSAAVLAITSNQDLSTVDFTMEARAYDWGGTLTSADWVAGASLSGMTLLAHYSTASGFTAGTTYNFVEDDFSANVNKTGTTYLILASDKTRTGTAPGGSSERVIIRSADQAGTTSDPKLTITHETGYVAPAGGVPLHDQLIRMFGT